MLNKKEKELESLLLVYALNDFEIVDEESEKPDFILKVKNQRSILV